MEKRIIESRYSKYEMENLADCLKGIGVLIEALTFATAHEGEPSDEDSFIMSGIILSNNLHEIAEAIYHPGDVTDESDE